MGTTADSRPRTRAPGVADRADVDARPADGASVLLVIEDEPGIVDFVRRGLEAEGFAVEAATTASRASGWR